jgi:hypothetical protein
MHELAPLHCAIKVRLDAQQRKNNKFLFLFCQERPKEKPKKIKLQSRKGRTASLKTNNTQSL